MMAGMADRVTEHTTIAADPEIVLNQLFRFTPLELEWSGRVAVRFIIGPSGAVQASAVASSNVSDSRVETCITSAVARWTFSAPEGSGIVSVTYPFVLQQIGQ